MFPKKILVPILFLTFITVNAQNNSAQNLDFNKLSSKMVYSSFESSLQQYTLLSSDNSAMNYLSTDYEYSEELGKDLTIKLFKKNRSGMEKTGRILTYIGVPLAIVGGIMVAGADELYYTCVNGNCDGDARGGFGVVALAAGLGLGGTGGVLWIIGSKR